MKLIFSVSQFNLRNPYPTYHPPTPPYPPALLAYAYHPKPLCGCRSCSAALFPLKNFPQGYFWCLKT